MKSVSSCTDYNGYLEPYQTFKMEHFAKIVNKFSPLTTFAKNFILGVLLGFKYTCADHKSIGNLLIFWKRESLLIRIIFLSLFHKANFRKEGYPHIAVFRWYSFFMSNMKGDMLSYKYTCGHKILWKYIKNVKIYLPFIWIKNRRKNLNYSQKIKFFKSLVYVGFDEMF